MFFSGHNKLFVRRVVDPAPIKLHWLIVGLDSLSVRVYNFYEAWALMKQSKKTDQTSDRLTKIYLCFEASISVVLEETLC